MLKKLFYLVFALIVLAQFTALNKSSGLNIYLFDLAVVIFALYGVFSLLISKHFFIPNGYLYFILFVVIALLSLILQLPNYSLPQIMVSSFYLIRLFFYLIAGLVVFNMLKAETFSPDTLVKLIIASGVFVSLFGLIQLIILPDFEILDSALGWDPHKNRLASTFFDPNFTAAYLVICFTLGLETLFNSKKPSTLLLLVLVILLSAIILTFSRSGWLFLSVIVLFYGFYRTKWLLVVSAVLVFSTYFAVPRIQTRISGITDPADSAHFRFISWGNTIEIIKDNPIFGVGYNAFRYSQQDYGFIEYGTLGGNSGAGSDASMLFVFATTGIIGLAVYVGTYLCYVLKAFYCRFRVYNLAIFAILIGLLIESIFINSLFYPQIFFVLLLLFAIVENSSSRSLEHM